MRRHHTKDRLDLSPEGIEAAENLASSNAVTNETSEVGGVTKTEETSSANNGSNLFLDVSNMRLAVLDRINTIIAESGLEIPDSTFQVELNRTDGTISVKSSFWDDTNENRFENAGRNNCERRTPRLADRRNIFRPPSR